MKKLKFIQKNLVWFIPGFMLFGLFWGSFFSTEKLKITIFPLTFVMIFPQMININFKQIFTKCNLKLQAMSQLINFFFIPFFAFLLGKIFFPNTPFDALGLLLVGILPTGNMTLAWIGFNKGNLNAGIKIVIIGLTLGSLLSPFYLHFFLGQSVEIPLFKILKTIAIIILIPLIVSVFTRSALIKKFGIKKFRNEIKGKISLFSSVGLLGMIFVATSLKAELILQNPHVLIHYFFPLLIFYSVNFSLITFLGKRFFSKKDAITFVYGTTMRNLSISLVVAMSVFGDSESKIAILIAMAFMFQTKLAAWYSHYVYKILK